MIELDPKQIHDFDMAYAASVDMLTELIASYISRRAEDEADAWPEQITVMALAEALAHDWDTDQLVSALAAAVVMIAEHTAAGHVD